MLQPSESEALAVSETLVSLAAAHKGVHYQTVRRAIARGSLRAMKVGGGVIIAASVLDAWRPAYSHAPRQPRRGGRGNAVTRSVASDSEMSAEDK